MREDFGVRGQFSPRTIPTQDDSHSRQFPPGLRSRWSRTFLAKGVGVGSRIFKFAGVGVGSRIFKFAGVGVGPFWSENNAKESGVGVGGVGPFWAKGVGVGSRIFKFSGVGVGSRILKFAGVGVGLFPSDSAALVDIV